MYSNLPGLYKIIFFGYPIFVSLVSMKVRKFVWHEFATKKQNLIMSTKLVIFLHIFFEVKKALGFNILSSYQLAYVTEVFFSDRNFCLSPIFSSSVTECFFYDRNFFSVTEM